MAINGPLQVVQGAIGATTLLASNLKCSGFDPFRQPHKNCLAYEGIDTERVSNMPGTSTTRLPLLTIRGIRTSAVEVPMKFPLGTSGSTVHSAPLLLIDLETEDGITGRTYLFCYRPSVPRAIDVCAAGCGLGG